MNFVFAAEVGMEVPLYNAGLLCEENQVKRQCHKQVTSSSCFETFQKDITGLLARCSTIIENKLKANLILLF